MKNKSAPITFVLLATLFTSPKALADTIPPGKKFLIRGLSFNLRNLWFIKLKPQLRREADKIQLVKTQPDKGIATQSELNPAPGRVIYCREARGIGYWVATQVKGLSLENILCRWLTLSVDFVESNIHITDNGEVM